jgi:putative Mg2+ transporter-C (MgtC) family protein
MGAIETFDAFLSAKAAALGWPTEAIVRMLLAGLCGGLIGVEREMRGRQAGFRTNILVCLGSSLVMIVSISLAKSTLTFPAPLHDHININTDPGRIPYGVMGGIGFLGAGTIIHNKGSIRGLTTAAALWCVAAIGLGCGLGLYFISTVASLMIISALWLLSYIEPRIPQRRYRQLICRMPWSPTCVADLVRYFKSHGFKIVDASFDRRDDPSVAMVTLYVAFRDQQQYYTVERQLGDEKWFELMTTRESQQ